MSRLQYLFLFFLGIIISFMTIPTLWNYFQPSSSNTNNTNNSSSSTSSSNQDVTVHTISAHYIAALRKLNAALLPVYYSDRLYRDVLGSSRYCKIALFKNTPIGAITSRLEDALYTDYNIQYLPDHDPSSPLSTSLREYHVYIMTLGVLAPYRRLGVGSSLLASITEEARKTNLEEEANPSLRPVVMSESTDESNGVQVQRKVITALTLHVQFNNTVGMNFYKEHGFETVKFIEHYYTRVEPRGAYLLIKKIDFKP